MLLPGVWVGLWASISTQISFYNTFTLEKKKVRVAYMWVAGSLSEVSKDTPNYTSL